VHIGEVSGLRNVSIRYILAPLASKEGGRGALAPWIAMFFY